MSTLRHFQGDGKLYVGSGSVTVSALAAGATEDLSITDSNAETTDVVCVSLLNADMEANLQVGGAWCSASGTIKLRIRNSHASSALTGGAAVVKYVLIKA